MKRHKPGSLPGKVDPPHHFENVPSEAYLARKSKERFASELTRSVFGRNYWNDRMAEELAADRKQRPKA